MKSAEVIEGHVFAVSWGFMGLATGEGGLRRLILPEPSRDEVADLLTREGAVLAESFTDPALLNLKDSLSRYFEGEEVDPASLSVRIDDRQWSPFSRRVYPALRQIGRGRRVTYGELADLAGSPGAARAVGGAVARNPLPLIVPCHRVLPRGTGLGGFSAGGGVAAKERLLRLEGVV